MTIREKIDSLRSRLGDDEIDRCLSVGCVAQKNVDLFHSVAGGSTIRAASKESGVAESSSHYILNRTINRILTEHALSVAEDRLKDLQFEIIGGGKRSLCWRLYINGHSTEEIALAVKARKQTVCAHLASARHELNSCEDDLLALYVSRVEADRRSHASGGQGNSNRHTSDFPVEEYA